MVFKDKLKPFIDGDSIDPVSLAQVALKYFLFDFDHEKTGWFAVKEVKLTRSYKELTVTKLLQFGDIVYELLKRSWKDEHILMLLKHTVTTEKTNLGPTDFAWLSDQLRPSVPLKSNLKKNEVK